MKKVTMGLAALALIFASCAKDETTSVNESNPETIGFSASTGKTRATSNDLTALKASATGFGVYATNGSTPAEFINNENYNWDATLNNNAGDWKWSGDAQMWPTTDAGYPVNFYAYYPDNAAVTDLSVADMTKSITLVETPDTQIDYLSAKTENVVARPNSSKVNLDFKHMLSKLDFKVVTGAEVTVLVQSISVKNVFGTRTFDYKTQAWLAEPVASDNQSYSYTAVANVAANTFVGATTATPVTTTTGSIMAMPQSLAARAWNQAGGSAPTTSESYIEVVYRVIETTSTENTVGYKDATEHPNYETLKNAADPEEELFVKVGYPLPTVWEMGYAYTYTIYLGTAAATGGYLIDDTFIDEDGEDTNLPVVIPGTVPPAEIEVPDPINDTDLPIGFVVGVTGWDETTPGINLE
jgi:hypothetical protein